MSRATSTAAEEGAHTMPRKPILVLATAVLTASSLHAHADGIDSLKGQFAFNWHAKPDTTVCTAIDDKQLTLFKSKTYICNLDAATNTASGEPARVCTERGQGAEYLIFATKKSCEAERQTQAANGE